MVIRVLLTVVQSAGYFYSSDQCTSCDQINDDSICAFGDAVARTHPEQPLKKLLYILREYYAMMRCVCGSERHLEKEHSNGLHDVVYNTPPRALSIDEVQTRLSWKQPC